MLVRNSPPKRSISILPVRMRRAPSARRRDKAMKLLISQLENANPACAAELSAIEERTALTHPSEQTERQYIKLGFLFWRSENPRENRLTSCQWQGWIYQNFEHWCLLSPTCPGLSTSS
jgi:hypothetical protein